jgi:hypothetical protein
MLRELDYDKNDKKNNNNNKSEKQTIAFGCDGVDGETIPLNGPPSLAKKNELHKTQDFEKKGRGKAM